MNWITAVTDLGDAVRITPVAIIIAFWVWTGIDRLTAAMLSLSYIILALVVFGLKMISVRAFGPPSTVGLFHLSSGAPSGHMALTVFVYSAAARLCGQARPGWTVWAARLICAAVIVAVAVTRVTLGHHTIADVLAGAAVGGLMLIAALHFALPARERHASAARLMAAIAAVDLLMVLSGLSARKNLGIL